VNSGPASYPVLSGKVQVALHFSGPTLTFSVKRGEGPMELQAGCWVLPGVFYVLVGPGTKGKVCSIQKRP
jgi:hypothetical protein